MSVDTSGVSVIDIKEKLTHAFSRDIKFDNGNGLIYVTSGAVIDPESRTLVGTFTFSDTLGTRLVEPDSTLNRVFFLIESRPIHKLLAFDSHTFVPVESLDIPNVSGSVSSLIRWGTDGLAFRTSNNQVFLINANFPINTNPSPSTEMGGSITGMSSTKGTVICQNITTRKRVRFKVLAGVRSWNCKQAGLVVNPGDIVRQSI